mmetsp:Transcript_100450/g.313047  ORF Transcript_100450/g.313047 Transcript_100450/m.313047 type:complete len:314 (+) Transcript_100450:676-1617(+)
MKASSEPPRSPCGTRAVNAWTTISGRRYFFAQGDRLGKLRGAQVQPPDLLPNDLVVGRPQVLDALGDKVKDHVLGGDREVIRLDDLRQHAPGQADQGLAHLRVGQEGLELAHQQLNGLVPDHLQRGTVIRAGNVDPAVLLHEQRCRLGEGGGDVLTHRVEEPADPEDVGHLQQQQRLGRRHLKGGLVFRVNEVQCILKRNVAGLRQHRRKVTAAWHAGRELGNSHRHATVEVVRGSREQKRVQVVGLLPDDHCPVGEGAVSPGQGVSPSTGAAAAVEVESEARRRAGSGAGGAGGLGAGSARDGRRGRWGRPP